MIKHKIIKAIYNTTGYEVMALTKKINGDIIEYIAELDNFNINIIQGYEQEILEIVNDNTISIKYI